MYANGCQLTTTIKIIIIIWRYWNSLNCLVKFNTQIKAFFGKTKTKTTTLFLRSLKAKILVSMITLLVTQLCIILLKHVYNLLR